MAISHQELTAKLRQNFPQAQLKLTDLVGDEDHYHLEITDEFFRGKSRIEQHQIVNEALEGILGTKLHALTVKTKAPK